MDDRAQTATGRHEVDVLIVSDLRFQGGTSHSIAEEIAAQSATGYRTGLVHLNGPLIGTLAPINPLIRRQITSGGARLFTDGRPITAKLVVIRHPAVIQHAAAQLPAISADKVMVVANAGPVDVDGTRHYDIAEVDRVVDHTLGQLPLWAPIGPLVRENIASEVAPERMIERDWVNLIDVEQWAVPRDSWQGDRPVVGRHSRPSPQKWPEDAHTLTQVYPATDEWDFRVLGGAEPVAEVLGRIPANWRVEPFGAISPQEFLAGLDFFVYYHDSRWVEAFGRTILEALASGVLAILPPHFERLFGPAARYAQPADVQQLVRELRADRAAYEAQVTAAAAWVRETCSYQAHTARLAQLVGEPTTPVTVRERSEPAVDRAPARVLMMSSNGSGMGHLTRLLAYARKLGPDIEPYFLSLSQAAPVVAQLGYRYEYLPSASALSMPPALWQDMFVDRVNECLDRVRPEVVVFDGTWPYNGIPIIRNTHPQVRWVWSRRGMWRAGANRDQLTKSVWFDGVVEPGDFAADYDEGATRDAEAHRVGPVTLLDRDEREDRASARSALGLPAEGALALISLGAGNINDTSSDIGAATAVLEQLGVGVCVTQPEIATSSQEGLGIHVVRDYPLARRLSAFDVVISAAGYNSFQELLRMGVPALFVPNRQTALDDQERRAGYATDRGWARHLDRLTVSAALPVIGELLERGTEMVAQAASVDPGNGADDAAGYIGGFASSIDSPDRS